MYKDKNKQREYQKLWWRARREEYFRLKKCEQCGSTVKLVIHHKNPEDKIAHAVWSWSQDRRNAELEKCIVLCDKCHRILHGQLKPLIHGTYNAYRVKKCRCEKCREWKHNVYINYKRREKCRLAEAV